MAVTTAISAVFSEAVQSGTILFTLSDSSGQSIPCSASYDPMASMATIAPIAPLKYSSAYTARLSGATDLAGNAMVPISWAFTTAAAPSGIPISVWSNQQVPGTVTDSDSSAVELGVKFRSDVDGYITGIRFYKSASNTGTHTGTLWSSTGQKLATGTFTNETASGWQTLLFASPVFISANTTYIASYHTNTGHYSADNNYFTSAGVDSGPLHMLRNGVDGGNGVYSYGTTSKFPTSTYQSSNYWVDVLFVPATTP